MIVLDPLRFEAALKEKGFRSITELAQTLGIHRNTVHYYLSGHGVVPENLEKILKALSLKPAQVLIEKSETPIVPLEEIAPLADKIHKKFPNVTLILFGSRARRQERLYSDWDIGCYAKAGLAHSLYRSIALYINEISEPLPFMIDVVNLNRADPAFLKIVANEGIFLTGNLQDWVALQKTALAKSGVRGARGRLRTGTPAHPHQHE